MLRVAVLVSGGGTNLQAIIDAVENIVSSPTVTTGSVIPAFFKASSTAF